MLRLRPVLLAVELRERMQISTAPGFFRRDVARNQQARRTGSNLGVRCGKGDTAVLETSERSTRSDFQAQEIADGASGSRAGHVRGTCLTYALHEDPGAVLHSVIVTRPAPGPQHNTAH